MCRGKSRWLPVTLFVTSALLPTLAVAHVSFEVPTVQAASNIKAVLRVPHGCDSEATHTVRVRIPSGVIAVKPMPKPGWQLATVKADYEKPYVLHGKPMTSGVSEIVWSGGNLPDDQFDEFAFQARIVDDLAPQTVLSFPTVQTCKSKTAAWTDIAAPGVDPHSLKRPAPTLLVQVQATKSDAAAAAPATKTYKVGNLIIETPWLRQPPNGARVAGGFMKITNTGKEADRLTASSVTFAKRVEIHEMAMADGVMRMRELTAGLEIKPGQTVELKPGGFHLMFMDIAQPPKAGETMKATVTFAKAGVVEIDVPVMAMSPGSGGGHKGH
jgi:uncharacterized protein YcnI